MSRKRKKKPVEGIPFPSMVCFCVRHDFLFLGGLQAGKIDIIHRPSNRTIGTILPDESISAPSLHHLEGVLQLIRDFNQGHAVPMAI